MTRRRQRTLPERDRTDSEKNEMKVIRIDRGANTVYANFKGCRITVICKENTNPDVCENVKGILISSFLDKKSV